MENLLAAINIPCWETGEKRENPLEDVNYATLAGVASGVGWLRAGSQAAPWMSYTLIHLSNFLAMFTAPFRSAVYSPQ